MEANELMIGDWVKSRGKIEQITSVYDGFICTDSFEDSHDYFFEPIPLTAEILKKNGFEEADKCYSFKDNYCSISIYLDRIEGEEIDNASIFLEGALFDMHININYVHELQHALRLCGIDKEIVL